MNLDFEISRNYENSLDQSYRKKTGIYYTPRFIVDYILSKTIKEHDILENPYPKIVDISCGCGNFLLQAYDELYELIDKSLDKIKTKYNNEYWNNIDIHTHIVSNCLYGYDIDEKAISILKKQLSNKSYHKQIEIKNLHIKDSLELDIKEKFDYIIGNPPYIGHKQIDESYRKYILKEYREVYRGKSDLYFCFCKKIIDILSINGTASIIIPRYFIESPSGKYLRRYINSNANIKEIIDFNGIETFKNVGISACILTLDKNRTSEVVNVYRCEDYRNKYDIKTFQKHDILKNTEDWIIMNNTQKELYEKIQLKEGILLENIVNNNQGIITGCDKAFVVKDTNQIILKTNANLLKSWIKNKDIKNYKIDKPTYKLIYSNDIDNPNENQEVIEYIKQYKSKLENRRECKKGSRKWYELQWGRDKEKFEIKKIVYPYKSSNNRFAIDLDGNFFSADVYSFTIQSEYENIFSYEYLVGILNSKIYNDYFKIIAKKVSKDIYDYYPNKVLKLKIFKDENYDKIESLSKNIISRISENEEVNKLEEEINLLIKSSLGLK